MATDLTSKDYTSFWDVEKRALLKASKTCLLDHLENNGFTLQKTSKYTPESLALKATVKVNLKGGLSTQTIALNMGKSGFLLWIDYKNNPALKLTQPPKELFLVLLQAEQKFIEHRLPLLSSAERAVFSPYINRSLSVDTIGADYRDHEPIRKFSIARFGEEYLRMLSFCPPLKRLQMSRYEALNVLDKNLHHQQMASYEEGKDLRPKAGGGLYELIRPSLETYQYKAFELSKVDPDPKILQWLNRRADLEIRRGFRSYLKTLLNQAQKSGKSLEDFEQVHFQGKAESLSTLVNFYNTNRDMFNHALRKESEVIAGLDTIIKESPSIIEIAAKIGFAITNDTGQRIEMTRAATQTEEQVVISIPKSEPHKYRNHTTNRGGEIGTFRREFPSAPERSEEKKSVSDDIAKVVARHGLEVKDLSSGKDQYQHKHKPGHQYSLMESGAVSPPWQR